jgi:hypothetical protein
MPRRRRTPSPQPPRVEDEPELHPLWGLFGVWGRVLVVFGVIGHLLWFLALLFGWPMGKLLSNVLGFGLLLLFSRPGYRPGLSMWLRSGYSRAEVAEIARLVELKLGLPPAHRPLLPVPRVHRRMAGSLGVVGEWFTWALRGR